MYRILGNMILAIGEILLDTFIEEEKEGYQASLRIGGAPFNLAARTSLKGVETAFYGSIGDDVFGEMVLEKAKSYPLSHLYLKKNKRKNTTLAVVRLQNGERSFDFVRNDITDTLLDLKDLSRFSLKANDIVHFGSLLLTSKEGFSFLKAVFPVLKKQSCFLSMDLNVRDKAFIGEDEIVRRRYFEILKEMDYVKGSDDDLKWLSSLSPVSFKEKYLKPESLFFLTHGEKGSEVLYRNEATFETERIFIPSSLTKAVDTTGAGDAFYASVLASLSQNQRDLDFSSILKEANTEGALATTYKGALPIVK